MATDGQFQVSQLVMRETPQLSQSGTVSTTTTVSFMVGPHGPYTLVFTRGTPAPEAVVSAVQSKVDQVKQIYAGLGPLMGPTISSP